MMNRVFNSRSACGLLLGLVATLAGCNLVTNPDDNSNGNNNTNSNVNDNGDSPGEPIPGSCITAGAGGLPAASAQVLFPTEGADVSPGLVTFLWVTGDAGDDSLEVTFFVGEQPDVFDNPTQTRTVCADGAAVMESTEVTLSALGAHYWGIEVTDGVTTVRRPADGVGVAFNIVAD